MRCVKKIWLWHSATQKASEFGQQAAKPRTLFEIFEDWCLETKSQAYPVLKVSFKQIRRFWIIHASEVQANRSDQLST
jgi:hypothetical protein